MSDKSNNRKGLGELIIENIFEIGFVIVIIIMALQGKCWSLSKKSLKGGNHGQ
jgi:hypothetical protein